MARGARVWREQRVYGARNADFSRHDVGMWEKSGSSDDRWKEWFRSACAQCGVCLAGFSGGRALSRYLPLLQFFILELSPSVRA